MIDGQAGRSHSHFAAAVLRSEPLRGAPGSPPPAAARALRSTFVGVWVCVCGLGERLLAWSGGVLVAVGCWDSLERVGCCVPASGGFWFRGDVRDVAVVSRVCSSRSPEGHDCRVLGCGVVRLPCPGCAWLCCLFCGLSVWLPCPGSVWLCCWVLGCATAVLWD